MVSPQHTLHAVTLYFPFKNDIDAGEQTMETVEIVEIWLGPTAAESRNGMYAALGTMTNVQQIDSITTAMTGKVCVLTVLQGTF